MTVLLYPDSIHTKIEVKSRQMEVNDRVVGVGEEMPRYITKN